jgi:hypothetical protein
MHLSFRGGEDARGNRVAVFVNHFSSRFRPKPFRTANPSTSIFDKDLPFCRGEFFIIFVCSSRRWGDFFKHDIGLIFLGDENYAFPHPR